MKRALFLSLCTLAGFAAIFGAGAVVQAQRAPVYDNADDTRAALADALEGQKAAEARAADLERQASAAENAAEASAQQAAALAARIQQAEEGIAAAQARAELVAVEQRRLAEVLGRQQQPMLDLTAALQQFARRPAVLGLLRPGEVKDVVYVRAVLDATVPELEKRTAGVRAQIARQKELREQAQAAAIALREEEKLLADRRAQLARTEARQRLEANQASGFASREAERALALAEQSRDLDSLVGQLDRAGSLRERLAALPGPIMRPQHPDEALAQAPETASASPASAGAPSPYVLPVAGRTVTGFGAPVDGALSRGVTLAPRAGALVVAPGAGRVAFAGPFRGFGQIVIVEHRGGWTSLVTGLASVNVSVGDGVVGGSPLGNAGPGRPSVSLELRRDGQAVNPVPYLR